MTRYIFFVTFIVITGCSKSKFPKGVLTPEKMQAVYWDYIKADVFANEYVRRDTSKNSEEENAKLQLQIFKLHNISREEFYKSYEYYLNNKELMKQMLDTMLVRHKPKQDTTASTTPLLPNDLSVPVKTDKKFDSVKEEL